MALLVTAGALSLYQFAAQPTTTSAESDLQTTTVQTGDLAVYVSGTGTLTTNDEVDLSFGVGGQITNINVKVGDVVQAGDVLAQIDNTEAQIAYTQAKRTLFERTSPAAIASAQAAIATSETDLASARNHLEYLISPRVLYWEKEIKRAEQALEDAQVAAATAPSDEIAKKQLKRAEDYLNYAKSSLISAQDSYEKYYVPEQFTVKEKDENGVTTYIGVPSEEDIFEARTAVTAAQTALDEATNYYNALTGGEIPADATGSGLTELEQAQIDLASAQVNLDKARIVAPIAGTVMAVNYSTGNTVSSSETIITLADLDHSYLEVFFDESDWSYLIVGNKAEVSFDVLSGSTFTGEVTHIDPGLYTESGTSVVRVIVKLEASNDLDLPLGTSASVDVTSGESLGATLVPLEALHQTSSGQETVYVLENGIPTLREVEVGLKDQIYAEATSGLQAGETIVLNMPDTE